MRETPFLPDDQSGESPQYHLLCSECQTGVLRLRGVTYFTWLHDELITVPNFPAWICDVCGRREYDGRAVTWLNTMLHPETGRRSPAHHRPLSPRGARPAGTLR